MGFADRLHAVRNRCDDISFLTCKERSIMNQIKLRIRNFGPIQKGFVGGDGYMTIPKVTLFCGPQGSGKSTIAKVLSSMIWLEKAAYFIGWNSTEEVTLSEKIIRSILAWHGMTSYFHKRTEISYRGEYLTLYYANEKLTVSTRANSSYGKPKIMYVPAERNFLYLLDSNTASKQLPSPLRTLLDEFKLSQKYICRKSAYDIPVNGYQYVYDTEAKDYYVINRHSEEKDAKTPMAEASSGLQAVLPMLLITDYLSATFGNSRILESGVPSLVLSANPFIYNKTDDGTIRFMGYNGTLEMSNILSGVTMRNSHFVNIVEEPEQNLFPPTQRSVLRHLLAVCNGNDDNRLVLSTHSPYVVADLVAAMKSKRILEKIEKAGDTEGAERLKALLGQCYPFRSIIPSHDVCLYETNYDGAIKRSAEDIIIPDSNFLNRHLMLGNKLFEELDNLEEYADNMDVSL